MKIKMQKNQVIFLANQTGELDEGEEHEILEIKHSEDETKEVRINISIEKLIRLQYEQQQYTHIRKMVKKNPEKLKMLYKIRPDDVLVKILDQIITDSKPSWSQTK